MPNLDPKKNSYGSRQKRIENFEALVNFLLQWKKNEQKGSAEKTAHRFCDMHFQYGTVTKKDITQQALMTVGLL